MKTRKKGKPPVPRVDNDSSVPPPPSENECQDHIYDFASPAADHSSPAFEFPSPESATSELSLRRSSNSSELSAQSLHQTLMRKKKSKKPPPAAGVDPQGSDDASGCSPVHSMDPLRVTSPDNTHVTFSTSDVTLGREFDREYHTTAEERGVWSPGSADNDDSRPTTVEIAAPPPPKASPRIKSHVARRDENAEPNTQVVGGESKGGEDTPWRYVELPDGRVYYVNTVSGETTWSLPGDV